MNKIFVIQSDKKDMEKILEAQRALRVLRPPKRKGKKLYPEPK